MQQIGNVKQTAMLSFEHKNSANYGKEMEILGIDPRAFRMRIERSTTELYPRA